MKQITSSWVLGLLAALSFSSARADDLLDILSGGSKVDLSTTDAQAKSQASVLQPLLESEGSEARIFLAHFERGDFEKALFHWPVAFGGRPFAQSANGTALYGYLLFKNGLPVLGLETLFTVERPTEISPILSALWKGVLGEQHPAWSSAQLKWKPEWTPIFGVGAEARVLARTEFEASQVAELKELMKKTNAGTETRAVLQWQLVLALSLEEKSGEAAQVLANLMSAPQNPVGTDLMTLTAARLLFQNGYLDAASAYYKKIPKASDEWLDAQEELGWVEMRKAQTQNVIAITETLVHPIFNGQIGPETVFLRSLAQLKVCDYPGVLKSLTMFRERFRTRTADLLALKENAAIAPMERFIEKARIKPVKLNDLGKDALVLPRFITRDHILRNLIRVGQVMEGEGQKAKDFFLRSMNYEGLQPGAQAHIAASEKQIAARVRAARDAVYSRVKVLVDEEIAEIATQLQKMHIVEAELLQHISLAEKRIAASRTEKPSEKIGTTGSQDKDRIWFPAEKETWFDELSNFKVDLKKGCQAKLKATKAKDTKEIL